MKRFIIRGLIFLLVGIFIYMGFYVYSERLVYQSTRTNRFFNIKSSTSLTFDYIIIGASHAMALGFEDMNQELEKMTGMKIINLATLGGGILPNRLILDYFFLKEKTKNVLYVIDAGAFYTSYFNEDRLKDIAYYQRAPFDLDLLRLLLSWNWKGTLDIGTTVDYFTGFSKVNNQDRYKRDISELELRFRKRHNPTVEEIQKRIKIVAQGALDDKAFNHYLPWFSDQIDDLRSKGVNLIVVKPPLPKKFYDALPNELIFDNRIKEVLAQKQVPFYDFSLVIPDYKYYFDTDHLNRTGVLLFFNNYLKEVLLKHAN